MADAEFSRLVNELTSGDANIKRLATQQLYVIMTGTAAASEAAAATAVEAMAAAIVAALP